MKRNWSSPSTVKEGSIVSLIPVTNRKFLYLITIIGAYFMYLTAVFKTDILLRTQGTICNAVLFILAITLFYKDTNPFFNKGKGILHLIEISLFLYASTIGIDIILSFFIHVDDPQNLARFMYDFSLPYVTYNIIKYIFVGIGEECFKLFIFLLFYGLFNVLTKGAYKKMHCFIAVVLTSFIFGALHNFYAPENWYAITLPIALSTMAYFYFLFKYKTIVPLMIVHAFNDIFVFLMLMNDYGDMLASLMQLLLYLLFLIMMARSYFISRRKLA